MKFSIVITSTRPHYLKTALRAALAQTHGDYEIIVSDNSKDGGLDVVQAYTDERIRYFRPDPRMELVAHWDYAFAQARGDWHLQLCDDDAITPNLLSILDEQIERHPEVQAIVWSYGVYRSDAHWSRPGQVGVNRFTGQSVSYDAKQLLAEMFNSGSGLFRIKSKIPFFPRAACRRDVLDAIRARQGRLFHKICPMTSGAVAVLALSNSILRVDFPLTLLGSTPDSAGGWTSDPSTLLGHLGETEIELAPIKLSRILPTGEAESMLRTQRAMPDLLGSYRIDYVNYFLHCFLFLQEAEGNGVDTSHFWPAFDDALAKMPLDIQQKVQAALRQERSKPKPSIFYRAKHALRMAMDPLLPARLPGETQAARLGLRDIFDCAVYVGALIDKRH
jgi:Glycosyl transferase family 2